MPTITVYGARGYLGRELLRLLLNHPSADAIVPVSGSAAGDPVGRHIPALRGVDLHFVAAEDPAVTDADIAFLATSDAEAEAAISSWGADAPDTIIDLSRLNRAAAIRGDGGWTYGLADLDQVPKGARLIANPGCYPTASLLAAGPALRAGLAGPGVLIADGKSGVSGAGATPRSDLHFPEANESVRAYKVLGHDHGHEIEAAANWLENGHAGPSAPGSGGATGAVGASSATRPAGATDTGAMRRRVRFTPHLVPQNRGLLATVYLPIRDGVDAETIQAAYHAAYENSPFVHVVDEPDTAHVRHSNRADVAIDLDPATGLLVARCAIDNLVKGGSGQAVQNMNHVLGLPAATGLNAVGGGP